MNKNDFITKLAERVEMTKKDVRKVFNNVVDMMVNSIHEGGDGGFRVSELGGFRVRKRQARLGKNPKTGETIKIAAQYTVAFRPSKLLKDKVNTRVH